MSEQRASALPGAASDGFVSIAEAGLCGMITLRGDLASFTLPLASLGLDIPATRAITQSGERSLAWMSPDELLLMLPYPDAAKITGTLQAELRGEFVTVANVSDARAVFALRGKGAPDVLAKLCPVDFAALKPGEIRRTRAGQVAAAIWVANEDEMRLVCFRSVAQYMFDLLTTAALPGSEPCLYS